MTKKLWTLMSLLLITVMLLAACSPAAAPTAAPTTAPQPTAGPTKAPEPTTPAVVEPVASIRIWADDTRSAILKDLADDFLAAYQVEVIVEEVAGIRDQFLISAPAGEGPDIIIIAHDQAGTLVANGLLAPIDLGAKAGEFVESALTAFTFDGQLYGMPYATENLGFFYNTELVDEVPDTWEGVLAKGKELQDAGEVTYCMSVSGTTYDLYPFFTAFGGYVFGKDAVGNYNANDLGLDNAGMIEAATLLSENVKNGCLSDNTDWDTAHVLFETGETPFIMAGPWALDRIRQSGIPYAVTSFPGGGFPFMGVQGFVINAKSENVLLAQAFLTEFVATEEAMQQLYEAGLRPSALLSVLEKTADPDLLAMGEAGAFAQAMPAIPAMGAVWGSWNDGITLIFQQKQEVEAALTEKATAIRNLIANPLTGMVNVPGSYQDEAGCATDWAPDCDVTKMTKGDGGIWSSGPFNVVAGDYEAKVALDGTWTTNYGVDGVADGPNYTFSLTADGTVEFSYDEATHILTITVK